MTNREAVIWLINISADIGKAEHRDLWHYEQALYEIREMLEDAPDINVGDMISRQAAVSEIMDDLKDRSLHDDPAIPEDYAEGYDEGIRNAAVIVQQLPSAQPDAPDTNVGTSKYTVSATAVEVMLKDLLPERGMWEIEGDEAKNAICETVHDALEGLWKLPSAQQEIIYCRDCKYNSNPPEYGNAVCDTFHGMTDQMGYCHMAERRENT